MSWGLIAGATFGAGFGLASKEMMGDSAVGGIGIPEFQEPEYYEDIQDQLLAFGEEGLEGKFPEYYRPIGDIGGPEFEAFLQRAIGDVTGQVTEAAARRNVRGGALDEAIAKTTGDISTQMRYQDLLTGLQGRQNLLGTSLNTLGNVRDSDLNYAQMANQFNLDRTSLLLNQAQAEDAWTQAGINSIIGGAMGGASIGSSIMGYNSLADSFSSGATSGGLGSASYNFNDLTLMQQRPTLPQHYGLTN